MPRLNPVRRLALVLALLAAPAAEALAQGPGAFARIGFGARGIGMGNALVADAFGPTSPFYNPALAPQATAQHVDAAAAFLTLGRELQHAQFAFPLPPRAGGAVGLVRAAVSGIDGRDAAGFHTRELSVEETVVFAAFGVRLGPGIAGGLGLRFYRADLLEGVDAPTAIGLSLGLTARPTERLALGLTADDLLARYRWDTAARGGGRRTDLFPVRLRLGAAYALADERGVLAAETELRATRVELRRTVAAGPDGPPVEIVTAERRTATEAVARLGAEWWLAPAFALRAGVDRLGEGGLAAATPAAGFAVRQRLGEIGLRADYTAQREPRGLGVVHVVALRLDL